MADHTSQMRFRVRSLFFLVTLCVTFSVLLVYFNEELKNVNRRSNNLKDLDVTIFDHQVDAVLSVPQTIDNDSGLVYKRSYNGKVYMGKAFNNCWNVYLRQFGLLNVEIADDSKVLASDPVFVTAFSDNHFSEAKSMLNHLRTQNKTKILYVYDIGLHENGKKQLVEFSSIIIELRTFPFHNYPDYVGDLHSYRWKPLIIAQMLLEHPSIWWLDTSAKMIGPIKTVYSDVRMCSTMNLSSCPYYPWLTVDSSGHSIFAATEPKMFDYLPLPTNVAKNLTMHGANLQLIYGIKDVKEKVLRYWVLCALEEGCLAPIGSLLFCRFQGDRYDDYGKCHRYDQSAVNILLAWSNNFNSSRYHHHVDNSFKIERF